MAELHRYASFALMSSSHRKECDYALTTCIDYATHIKLIFYLHPKIAFVWIFLQELVTGKGVLQGIDEGNWFFLFNAGLFGILVFGLTGWLAIQGDDDYTKA